MTLPLLHYVANTLFVALLILIFYSYYFTATQRIAARVWQFKSFLIGVVAGVIVLFALSVVPGIEDRALELFFYGALLEEVVRFSLIWLRLHFRSNNFTLRSGVSDGILIGLGFAFVENLHFSSSVPISILLLRSFVSLPFHIIVSSLMSYYLSRFVQLNLPTQSSMVIVGRSLRLPIQALAGAVILHAVFNHLLFLSGWWPMLNIAILLPGLFMVHFRMSHLADLEPISKRFNVDDPEELEVLRRQENHERWISSFTEWESKTPLLLQLPDSLLRPLFAAFLAIVGIVWYLFLHSARIASDVADGSELELIFVLLYPLSFSALLLGLSFLNFIYLQEHLLRLPLLVPMIVRDAQGVNNDVIALDLLPSGLILTGYEECAPGLVLELHFLSQKRVIIVHGVVTYVAHEEYASGVVVRFIHYGVDFYLYLWHYTIRKLSRRMQFLLSQGGR